MRRFQNLESESGCATLGTHLNSTLRSELWQTLINVRIRCAVALRNPVESTAVLHAKEPVTQSSSIAIAVMTNVREISSQAPAW